MQIENEFSFRRALTEGINLFLGAGFSLLAKDAANRPLPTGGQLAAELTKEFELTGVESLNLPEIAAILASTRRSRLREYLASRFTVSSFDDAYKALQKINVAKLFTTNIDDLLFKIYSGSRTHYLNDLDLRGAAFRDRTAVDLVTLHGSVLDSERDLTFAPNELAAAFQNDPDRWHFLTEALQTRPTLFWGYSLADAGTLQALHPRSVGGRALRDIWITVPPDASDASVTYFTAIGFQIIRATTAELLSFISAIVTVDGADVVVNRTERLLPEYSIPDITQVPVRPLFEFYRGAAPTWYDIFSGRLHRTRYHAAIRNAISSGRHVAAVGVPGCGKSTLLMQVAADYEYRGHKLFLTAPTIEKADFVAATLGEEPALLFIDNFADSVDAFERLQAQRNVQIVAADRHYNFEIISHKVSRDRLTIVDITDLDDADTQRLFEHIPPEVRIRDKMQLDAPPVSLFEFIQSQVVGASLSGRFRGVFGQLRRADERLLNLLLATAYVHSCRTAMSLDMLMAFFRNQISGHREITDLRRRLGGMVVDYAGELDDGEQDYFVARSTLLAEAIMAEAFGADLRLMLLRFHNEISAYRIHRYDIFKRRAYDAVLMHRAFDDWQEGLKFYRTSFDRERSPYIMQQAALFLARKHRYTEAFSAIDEALVRSGNRIQSIRNSHAIILFSANYNKDENELVRRTLQQSMEILRECYEQDKRKAYHAMTFGNHALKYQDRYPQSPESDEYLRTSLVWLNEEKRRAPWNRDLERLAGVVKRRVK